MTALTILPAVDLIGGEAVQLVRGVASSATVFGDPVTAARRWQAEGAKWLHLVDLDAAFGRGGNAAAVARIAETVDLQIELSGGIRDQAALERALATGAARVNLGTAALENPAWCAEAVACWPDRVAVSLDIRDGRVAGRGWTMTGPLLEEVVARLDAAGCRRYVVTAIASDGAMAGPDLTLLRHVAALTGAALTASGGIARLDDLRALRGLAGLGVDSAIVGTALYVGAFALADALRVATEPAPEAS
ncbi:MAG: bifunctional 1-(5-phosphoribosyl)-5-((5-phosphoribosylamino)methylideneamino)imidazole-4-carboxamide isomerase/phosphoribosylanthranilate isomerase PriA [Propionibacteriaceae bacterium]|jgi:phosphoribosylanthranilate isomerase|nr:bifunctional 1-(5-phosphoribosyl)-5-((5-phosphoribosylamino)methylideneamino)imidazole-4-carboxamide isomerase/phosphoribosylanthranilate isomerase PriA [Propionibacteriaceae bacterium]